MINATFFRSSDGHVVFHHSPNASSDGVQIMYEAVRKLEGIEGSPPLDSPLKDSVVVEWAVGVPAFEALDKYLRSIS